eukprot:5256285-Amphidinium_carterae.1
MDAICPFHVAESHLRLLEVRFGTELDGTPLFCTIDRTVAAKTSVVATIVSAAHTMGIVTVSPEGTQRFGGHSLRTGGAYWLASQG